MAIIVEDGTGLPDAESYISVAELQAYCTKQGKDSIAALPDARLEVLLRQATTYMLGAYGPIWKGARAVPSQALDWPRSGVVLYEGTTAEQAVADNVVPQAVKDCCALLATKANARPLLPDGSQLVKRVKIGPIEREFDNEGNYCQAAAIPQYFDAGRLIVAYTCPAGPYSVKLVRS